MDRCDEKVGENIISIVNKSLPTPDEKCTAAFKEYLQYIGDTLLHS
jgi:hypothetical protein